MTTARQPHIAPDLASRRPKAEKILRLLDLSPRDTPWRVLEVGTGSGGIAHFLGTHPAVRCAVNSVDIVDLRMVHDGYAWQRVEDTTLPFPDAAFDIVITNHVIEHVGEYAEQLHHLRECRRVLVPGGRGYLAVPNRWSLIEPHFRLPFLSWLPRAWRSPYVRAMKRGAAYDCELLTLPVLEGLLAEAGLQARNMGAEALRATLLIEGTRGVLRKCVAEVPDGLWRALAPWVPTLIYRFTR